jgi:dTDP-4-dehydrorhamnose 3,5-epimerase
MKVIKTEIPGLLLLEPKVYEDNRGFFMESYQEDRYKDSGITESFVQDNLSFSQKNTLRGLHYQYPKHGQAKLVQVLQGAVYDVAVDIRQGSPAFGKWLGFELSESNKRQLFIPSGFAHGFLVLSETALFTYKCSELYSPVDEKGILYSDPVLGIQWPKGDYILSDKDLKYPRLGEIPTESLPEYIG